MPLYTAWVDPAETFDPATHARHDFAVRELVIEGREGEAPTCRAWLEPPDGGWLAPLRPRWAMIAYAPTATEPAVLLFRGQQVGAPSDMGDALVEMMFDARSPDHLDRLADALQPFKVGPHYDPLFVDEEREDDPAEVLDGWHRVVDVSRLDGTVAIVDATVGARTIVLGGHQVEGASVRYRPTGAPVPAVTVRVEAQWVQRRSGVVDVGAMIRRRNGGPIRTLTAPHLFAEGWPKPDSSLGGRGWKTGKARLVPSVPDGYGWPYFKVSTLWVTYLFDDQTYEPELEFHWTHEQRRVERVELTVTGDAQPLAALAEPARTIDLRLRDVSNPVTVSGVQQAAPLGDPARASFFLTERGRQAVAHAVLVAAVELAASQRCVEVSARLPGWSAELAALGTDAAVTVESPRLPGGTATGKVVSYAIRVASGGVIDAEVRAACSIGRSRTYAESAGTAEWADGWAGPDWQHHAGATVPTGADAPPFLDYSAQVPTKGIVALPSIGDEDLVPGIQLHNVGGEQQALFRSGTWRSTLGLWNPNTWLSTDGRGLSWVRICRADLNPVDDAEHVITVAVPEPYGRGPGIDLEAS